MMGKLFWSNRLSRDLEFQSFAKTWNI